MCQEQTDPFSVACNAMLCAADLAVRATLLWVLANCAPSPSRAASPSRRERGECGRPSKTPTTVRVRRRPAPPEPTGPCRRGRLAGVRRPSRKQRLCLHQEQLISQSGLPQCVRLSFTGREEEQLCLQHCRTPAVDNDSLEVRTSTRSRTRSSRRDGRCACHMRARRLDDAVDGPRAPQSGAAQQEQPPWLHDVNHTYHHTPATVGGATRSDPPPSLDSEFRKS